MFFPSKDSHNVMNASYPSQYEEGLKFFEDAMLDTNERYASKRSDT